MNELLNKVAEEEKTLVKKSYNKLAGLVPLITTKVSVDQNDKTEKEEIKFDNKVEVDINQFSVYNKKKNILIKFLGCIIPYSSHQDIIKIHHNSTILLTFKIYRFTILLSIIAFLTFIWECIVHLLKKRKDDTLKDL